MVAYSDHSLQPTIKEDSELKLLHPRINTLPFQMHTIYLMLVYNFLLQFTNKGGK